MKIKPKAENEADVLMGEHAMRWLEALSQVVVSPSRTLERVMNGECQFVRYPSEETSDEDPPLLLDDSVEIIPIEAVLGLYAPTGQRITIYRKGIECVSKILKVREKDLTFIVRLHEWAHALIHVGVLKADVERVRDNFFWPSYLKKATRLYNELAPGPHELLAQLLVFQGLLGMREAATLPEAKAAIERMVETFERVMQRAPRAYKIDDYFEIQKHQVVQSILLLKSR